MNSPNFRHLIAAGAAILSLTTTALVPAPAYAQLGGIVHDPRNYAQNILTAARTLEQINNQIRQLQNQATSLINEARNLQGLPLTVLEPLQAQIRQTQQLIQQAQRMRSEEHTSELQSLMRISYAVFCLKKKTTNPLKIYRQTQHRQN